MAEALSILVVEDDADDYFLTRSLLARATTVRCEPTWAQTYEDGLEALVSNRFDVSLVDFRLGAHDGLELLREAATRGNRTPVILLTGQNDPEVDLRAAASGAEDYLVKGRTDAALLERAIRYARERRRAEEQIRDQADLLDQAQDAILAFRSDGRVAYCNQSTARLTGYTTTEVSAGEGVVFNLTDPPIVLVLDRLRARGEWAGELHIRTKDQRVLTVESRWTHVRDGGGRPETFLAILTDVTERKQLEAQFLRAQRMESIGRLVGGIAHDLGNLLVPVLLGVKVLQTRFSEDEKAMRTLSMIQKSAQRGGDMVKQVLTFARGVEGKRVHLDVSASVEEVEKIVRETFGAPIVLTVRLEDGLWPVVGDATQIQQVLVNLAVNARDAMGGEGALAIEADNIALDEHYAQTNIEAKPGRYVRLTVTDSGTGITPDVIDKIFEPFFTTKSVEKGTGLGLSTVYSITKSHGGFVTVYSEIGHGTTFGVYLPAADASSILHSDDSALGETHRGQGELVLIVDDEEFILETTRDLLEETGYRAVTARNGREGLETWRAHRADIAVVLTDVMMPEMDGIALIRALRAEAPDLPIVAASGMMGEKADEVTAAGATTFLSKPFTVARLTGALSTALGRGDGQKSPVFASRIHPL